MISENNLILCELEEYFVNDIADIFK